MQSTEILVGCKNEIFHWKNFDLFLIFAQKLDCGYTSASPYRGSSNESPQSRFWNKKIRKIIIDPCKPQFFYKSALSGVQEGILIMEMFS